MINCSTQSLTRKYHHNNHHNILYRYLYTHHLLQVNNNTLYTHSYTLVWNMSVSRKLTVSVLHLYLQKSALTETSSSIFLSESATSWFAGSGSVSTTFFLATRGMGVGAGGGVALVLWKDKLNINLQKKKSKCSEKKFKYKELKKNHGQ